MDKYLVDYINNLKEKKIVMKGGVKLTPAELNDLIGNGLSNKEISLCFFKDNSGVDFMNVNPPPTGYGPVFRDDIDYDTKLDFIENQVEIVAYMLGNSQPILGGGIFGAIKSFFGGMNGGMTGGALTKPQLTWAAVVAGSLVNAGGQPPGWTPKLKKSVPTPPPPPPPPTPPPPPPPPPPVSLIPIPSLANPWKASVPGFVPSTIPPISLPTPPSLTNPWTGKPPVVPVQITIPDFPVQSDEEKFIEDFVNGVHKVPGSIKIDDSYFTPSMTTMIKKTATICALIKLKIDSGTITKPKIKGYLNGLVLKLSPGPAKGFTNKARLLLGL